MKVLAIGALFLLGPLGFLLLASQNPTCLGPLGITVVGCARATGVFPSNAAALLFLGACLFAGGLVALLSNRPPRRTLISGTILALLAIPIGVGLYALTRPVTLEGPAIRLDGVSTDYVVLALPFETSAALGFALITAGLALTAAAMTATVRGRHLS